MAGTITLRPDEDAERALEILTRDGTWVSTAVRSALMAAARERVGTGIREEAQRLAADEQDPAEAAQVLTSTAARPATFRPEVHIGGRATRVLAEQTAAVDPSRLGASAGHLTFGELRRLDAALRLVLDLTARMEPRSAAVVGTRLAVARGG